MIYLPGLCLSLNPFFSTLLGSLRSSKDALASRIELRFKPSVSPLTPVITHLLLVSQGETSLSLKGDICSVMTVAIFLPWFLFDKVRRARFGSVLDGKFTSLYFWLTGKAGLELGCSIGK